MPTEPDETSVNWCHSHQRMRQDEEPDPPPEETPPDE